MREQRRLKEETDTPAVNVRYIVDDVASAIEFYTSQLGFEVEIAPVQGFAALTRDGFRLYINAARWSGVQARRCRTAKSPSPVAGIGYRLR